MFRQSPGKWNWDTFWVMICYDIFQCIPTCCTCDNLMVVRVVLWSRYEWIQATSLRARNPKSSEIAARSVPWNSTGFVWKKRNMVYQSIMNFPIKACDLAFLDIQNSRNSIESIENLRSLFFGVKFCSPQNKVQNPNPDFRFVKYTGYTLTCDT